MNIAEVIIGGGVVILNLVPFLLKKQKYLFLTAIISVMMIWLLLLFK